MAEVFFYQLQHSSLEGALRVLLDKARGAGWRIDLRTRSEALAERLDEQLWLLPEHGFLPHGRAGGPHDADQPILLTTGQRATNTPACVVSVEGAAIAPDDMAPLARAMILFDGQDPAALQTAREQWKTLTAAGVKAKYWSEESGSWQMKAESAGE